METVNEQHATPEDREPAPKVEIDRATVADDDKTITSPAVLSVQDAAGHHFDAHHSAGLAIIEQRAIIPQTGARRVATKLEYWTYIVYCTSHFEDT